MTLRFAKPILVSFVPLLASFVPAISFTPVIAQTRTAAVSPRPPAPAALAVPAQPQVPTPEAMIVLIRSSIVALSHANLTNNYSVLNALGSPSFKQANPPAKLQQLFAPFRANNIDMNPVVFVTPQLKYQPAVQEGRLRLIGFFPTAPLQVNYDLQFEPSGGVWRLFGIAVDLSANESQVQSAPQQGKAAPQGR
jgi:hypothetical protein